MLSTTLNPIFPYTDFKRFALWVGLFIQAIVIASGDPQEGGIDLAKFSPALIYITPFSLSISRMFLPSGV